NQLLEHRITAREMAPRPVMYFDVRHPHILPSRIALRPDGRPHVLRKCGDPTYNWLQTCLKRRTRGKFMRWLATFLVVCSGVPALAQEKNRSVDKDRVIFVPCERECDIPERY